jgi:hypothetical protein
MLFALCHVRCISIVVQIIMEQQFVNLVTGRPGQCMHTQTTAQLLLFYEFAYYYISTNRLEWLN